MSFLRTQGLDARRESRRIAVGLVVLTLVSVALFNVAVYQTVRNDLAHRRWDQLAASVESKRGQINRILDEMRRHTHYVAENPTLVEAGRRALAGTLTPELRAKLERELDRTALNYKLHHLTLLAPDGALLARSQQGADFFDLDDRALAQQAAATRQAHVGSLKPEADGSRLIEIAVPLALAPGATQAPVLLWATAAEAAIQPVLDNWTGFGAAGRAYLVRQERDAVVYLTPPGSGASGANAGRAGMADPRARAAAMAAAGVESNVEFRDGAGRIQWAATRSLPDMGWGIVAEVQRDMLLADLRATQVKLLMLDLALIVLALFGAWLWRRQYRTGLRRHELRVTERHAARVQAVLDTAFDAIITFDREGRVRTVNRAAEQLLGRTASELDGQPLHRFVHWGGAAGRPAQQSLPTPGVVTVAEALSPDGQTFPVEFSLGQSGEGQELLYTAIVRDIRERVESEQRIRTFAEGLEVSNRRLEEVNAQLQEASRLKSEFLANTSHELRTPLNGIIGFLQLVLDDMCENKDEERDFLKQALQCSRHLLGLINDVLDIAKIEAGKLSVEAEQVDVRSLFAEVQTVTRVQAAQKNVTLRFLPPEDDTLSVRCDFAKTKQILINLVGNSLKFTAKGSIAVKATPHPDLGHFMFEIVDTGIGIPQDRQKLIFEKFTQADGSTTRKYGGTGLGLAISRSLVELMGGIIGVQSDGEGRGTRMYFSLPMWRDEAHEALTTVDEGASERIEGPAGGALVLLVEDDPSFRKFLSVLLHQHGYRTVQANHAEGGWLLARRLRPAIVVLDYALSCSEGAVLRNGWDLAERMTSDAATRHIPMIFVTGFDLELRDKLRSTAFARKPEHIMKPADSSTLIAKIEAMVGSIESRHVRVLMADDDPSVTAYVRRVLPESRFHMEIANNGEECLHILRTQPRGFDLLLLDLMMPEVSGYDVLREMTLTGLASELPVLILTNYPDARNPDEKRLLEQGLVLDVLPKTSVHDNPQLLSHIIDWHMQVVHEGEGGERAA